MAKDKIKSIIPEIKIPNIQKAIQNELDFDFSVNEKVISSVDEFKELLLNTNNNSSIFYRGERCNSKNRHLVPTMLRQNDFLFRDENQPLCVITINSIIDIYSKMGNFLNVYNEIHYNKDDDLSSGIYYLLSFAQHYLDISPFIDFTKSPFIALSFALKDRQVYDEDILIYTVEILNENNCTNNILIADKWLNDYKVTVSRPTNTEQATNYLQKLQKDMKKANFNIFEHRNEIIDFFGSIDLEGTPTAKLIDAPTNDLMKYQQGVFLLLSDFNLFYNTYFTKSIRQDFNIKKFIIKKEICPELFELLKKEKPHYLFKYLTDMPQCFRQFKNDFNKNS